MIGFCKKSNGPVGTKHTIYNDMTMPYLTHRSLVDYSQPFTTIGMKKCGENRGENINFMIFSYRILR